ncbi:hypothetical protein [Pyruvatibacter mobilis]|uniref:hypothetical protein n=1 Tax=Pyruvatibacter mobilis TaxID=1712261 RepID=UPI003BAA6F32
MTKTTLLIDGDLYAYRAMCAVEEETEWDTDVWTLTCDHKQALRQFDEAVDYARDKTYADDVVYCFSDARNWRKELNPTYKANRKKVRKPVGYLEFIASIMEERPSYQRPALEADDIMGIIATHPGIIPGTKVIASFDKDMQQVPGLLWDSSELREVSPEQSQLYHMAQTLSGDAVDNYPGCPGIGSSRADEIVKKPTVLTPYLHELKRGPRKGEKETRYEEKPTRDLWKAVVSRFVAAGLTEDDALMNARLARICQHTEYDFTKKEVILWTP